MRMKTTTLLAALVIASAQLTPAAPLSQSTITEIIKEVSLLPPSGTALPVKLNDLVKAPDRVRTGAESRTELTAADNTITRVGANTVFSFEGQGRVLNLERGSLLFHSPKGAGGGTIKSGGASAAILGTTIIVAATADGGFKLIVLEGRAKATLPNGKSIKLKAGQMVYVLPGGKGFSQVLDINLGKLVDGSFLVTGFDSDLPSLDEIREAVRRQNKEIAKGRAKDIGITADEFARKQKIGNGLDALDNNTYSTFPLPLFRSQGRPTVEEQLILLEAERINSLPSGSLPPLPPTDLTPLLQEPPPSF